MRLSRSVLSGMVVLVLLLGVGTVFAQGGSINVGDTLTQNAANSSVDFTLTLSSGQNVTIDVVSDAFDTYVEVIDSSGAILSFDDDSGDAFNSRLTFTAPSNAAYTVRVRSFAGNPNGRFTITVSADGGGGGGSTNTIPASGDVINVGDTVSGNSTSRVTYSLQLSSGQTVTIEAQSNEFDTYLEVYDSNGALIGSDDDGGAAGTNSLLTLTAPSAGVYTIVLKAFGSDNANGAYTLIVTGSGGGGGTTPPSGDVINVGDTISGSSTGRVAYNLQLSAGQTVTIEAQSSAFDTYLEVYDGSGNMVASDDDGGAVGTNSLLSLTASSAGVYTVVVRAFGSDFASGDYTLIVTGSGGGGPTTDQSGGALEIPSTVTSSAMQFADYTVTLTDGQAILINLISEQFDTYLTLLDAQGNELATDDDGGDSTNSRLFFTPASGGVYTIRVGSCCPNPPNGNFTLTVEPSNVVGEAQGGELTYGSSFTFEPNGAITSTFFFTGRTGDVINLAVITTTSEDTRLFLYGPGGAEVATDDDSGMASNPALRRFELPETGSYTVEIQGYNEEPVFDPFQISLERSELLILNNGPATLSLNQDNTNDKLVLDVEAGQQFIITITASEEPEATTYVAIQEAGESYAATNVTYANLQVMSFLYTAETSGRTEIKVEHYAYDADFVDFTFTAEPYADTEAPTPTPSK